MRSAGLWQQGVTSDTRGAGPRRHHSAHSDAEQVALASGSDEDDKKEVKPLASVPASGGSATVASERDTNFYLHNLEGNFFASGGSKPASGGSGPALAAERW